MAIPFPQTQIDNYPPFAGLGGFGFDDFPLLPFNFPVEPPEYIPQEPQLSDDPCREFLAAPANGGFNLWISGEQYSNSQPSVQAHALLYSVVITHE